MFCRVSAKEVSALKPALDAQKVRLVGVGLEELGVEEFVEGGFFAGELYIDLHKKCYKDLNYNRTSLLGLVPSLIGKKGRDAISKGRQSGVGNNFQGDGYQSGGVIIVTAGGEKTLFSWKQTDPTDHIDPQLISKALNLDEQPTVSLE